MSILIPCLATDTFGFHIRSRLPISPRPPAVSPVGCVRRLSSTDRMYLPIQHQVDMEITVIHGRRLIVLFISLALLAAACGGDDAVTTTTAAPATTVTEAPTTSVAPTTTTAAPTTTSNTTTTEPPPAGPPPGSVLITNEDGVYVGTIDGVASQVIDADPGVVGGMIGFAIDDTVGGIVFQPNRQPFIFMGDDSIVYWIPRGSRTSRTW